MKKKCRCGITRIRSSGCLLHFFFQYRQTWMQFASLHVLIPDQLLKRLWCCKTHTVQILGERRGNKTVRIWPPTLRGNIRSRNSYIMVQMRWEKRLGLKEIDSQRRLWNDLPCWAVTAASTSCVSEQAPCFSQPANDSELGFGSSWITWITR